MRNRHFKYLALCVSVSSLALTSHAWAASGLQVRVISEASGRPVAGAVIDLDNRETGFHCKAVTDANGQAVFDALPTNGAYQASVEASGDFDGQSAQPVELRSNFDQSVTFTVTPKSTEVVVRGKRAVTGINTVNAEISASLSFRTLQSMSIEGRDVVRALVHLPNVVPSTGFFPEAPVISVNGANGLYVNYLVDGFDNNENFLGGPKFPLPLGFTRDVTVLANSYSPEYGRSANGVINFTTPSGTNDLHGEVYVLDRPGRPIDSRSPFIQRDLSGNSVSESFSRLQAGVSIGGPIVRDQTFFYANLELTRERFNNLLDAPALNTVTNVRAESTYALASVRIDHRLNDNWTLSVRGNAGDVSIDRAGGGLGGGNVSFPSSGSQQLRNSAVLAASLSYSGDLWTYEGGLQYSQFRWDYARPLVPAGPQVVIEGQSGLTIGVVGNPGYVFNDFEKTWQTFHRFQRRFGDHSLTFGADLISSDFSLLGGGNAAGNYAVQLTPAQLTSLNALNRGAALNATDVLGLNPQVLDYSVELRPQAFGTNQALGALYVQDAWRLNSQLTATLGLRWDYDSLTAKGSGHGQTGNLAPRLALNYHPDAGTSWRFGAGRYYGKIPYTVISDALQQNTTSPALVGQLQQLKAKGLLPSGANLSRITFDGNLSVNPACAQVSACPSPAAVQALRNTASLNEVRILNPNGYRDPYADQISAGFQKELSGNLSLSADLIYSRSYDLVRLRDLNAPAPFTPNLANLTSANIAALKALPDNASRLTLAQSLGLVRSQAAADATRPVAMVAGGARDIVVSESAGGSKYAALNLQLTKSRGDDRYAYRLSYTLSRLANNTDDLNFRAADANNFSTEWGPSANDRTHVISALGFFYPTSRLTVTVAGLFQSGQPINYVPDASIFGTQDLNGDGQSFGATYVGNSDRYPGFRRNSGRLHWSSTIDLGLRYYIPVSNGTVQVTADVFNLFNSNNVSGFANAATTSNQTQFGNQAFAQRTAAPPRQFQFGLSWKY